MTAARQTTIRFNDQTLHDVDEYASEHGLTRNAMVGILLRRGLAAERGDRLRQPRTTEYTQIGVHADPDHLVGGWPFAPVLARCLTCQPPSARRSAAPGFLRGATNLDEIVRATTMHLRTDDHRDAHR